MKRVLVSMLLVLTLVMSSICSVAAAGTLSLAELKTELEATPVAVNVNVFVKSDNATDTGYKSSLKTAIGSTVDFKAELDMAPVKNIMNNLRNQLSAADKAILFGKAITGEFVIKAEWSGLTAPTNLVDDAVLSYETVVEGGENIVSTESALFEEVGPRVLDGNTITTTVRIRPEKSVLGLLDSPDFIRLSAEDFVTTSTPATIGGKVTASVETENATTTILAIDGENDATISYVFTVNSATVTKPSSSSGGSAIPTIDKEVTTNPNGSTTVTTTDRNGTTTQTTTNTDGSSTVVETKKDGTVTTTEKDTEGTVTEKVEKPDGSSETAVKDADGSTSKTTTDADGSSKTSVELSEKATTTEDKNVKLPMESVQSTDNAEKAAVVDVKLPANVTEEAPVNVVIPVENPTSGTVAVLVNEDGTTQVIRTSVTTEDGVVFAMTGSATVQIVDNSKNFVDIDGHWAVENIDFVTSREIFKGTSETTFEPETSMTRAMFVQVIHNIENNPDHNFDGKFYDVEDHHWYNDAVHWAADEGIVTGYTNGNFGSEDVVTREQLVAMLWRYAGNPESAAELDFSDADKVSEYAKVAMSWAVENGIINGTSANILSPTGTATRAQVATMLQRFCALAFN